MILEQLKKKDLIHPPKWLIPNTHYLVQMGSIAYGVAGEASDEDLYGFCIPDKETIFPHLAGEIEGFGKQKQKFEQYLEQHITDQSDGHQYDITVYNIVKFFQLCMENNPNMVDTLFVPVRCIKHITNVGNIVRDNRHLFLHKGCFHKMKGYAYSQIHKLKIKTPSKDSKRSKDIETHGYDTKFLYHCTRLMLEAEQILTEGTLDLERNKEMLKEIRRGGWTEQQGLDFFNEKEKQLEKTYNESKLPWGPPEDKIKIILLNCLESHYGSLEKTITINNKEQLAVKEIKNVIEKYKL